jgi:hypothetical protein
MATNRRRPPKTERDALNVWLELARSADSGTPIPEHVAEELRSTAREIRRLASPWDSAAVAAKAAAAQAAAVAGLTGRAIADFRADQRALWTRGLFEAARHLPDAPRKSAIVAGEIMSSVGERQVYKRIRRHKRSR